MVDTADELAMHLMNAHGVNRPRALNDAKDAPVVKAPARSPGKAPAAMVKTATNSNRAKVHAESLQILGWVIVGLAALGLIIGSVGAASADAAGVDFVAIGFLFAGFLGTVVVWAILKAIALHLLLTVDQIAARGET